MTAAPTASTRSMVTSPFATAAGSFGTDSRTNSASAWAAANGKRSSPSAIEFSVSTKSSATSCASPARTRSSTDSDNRFGTAASCGAADAIADAGSFATPAAAPPSIVVAATAGVSRGDATGSTGAGAAAPASLAINAGSDGAVVAGETSRNTQPAVTPRPTNAPATSQRFGSAVFPAGVGIGAR